MDHSNSHVSGALLLLTWILTSGVLVEQNQLNRSYVEQYLRSPTVTLCGNDSMSTFNVLQWHIENENKYQTLAKVVYELYAIPVM